MALPSGKHGLPRPRVLHSDMMLSIENTKMAVTSCGTAVDSTRCVWSRTGSAEGTLDSIGPMASSYACSHDLLSLARQFFLPEYWKAWLHVRLVWAPGTRTVSEEFPLCDGFSGTQSTVGHPVFWRSPDWCLSPLLLSLFSIDLWCPVGYRKLRTRRGLRSSIWCVATARERWMPWR